MGNVPDFQTRPAAGGEADAGTFVPAFRAVRGHPGAAYPGRDLMLLLQSFTTETDRYIDAVGHRHGMHRTDLNALTAVLDATREGQPMTPGALGARLALSSAATTALVDRLGRTGHMIRSRNDADRRQVRLEATGSARDRAAQIFAPMVEELLRVAEHHSAEELAILAGLVAELRDAVVRARERALADAGPATS
jgi:DNA-binding MarR family transcriptional regulator